MIRFDVVVCAPIGTTTLVGIRGNLTLCMANCMCELENAPRWLLCSADGYMRVKKMARKQKRRTGLPSPNIGVNKIMHRMFTIINCVGLRESEHWEPVLQHRFSFYALKSTYTTIGVYFVCRILLNGERFLFYFYYFSLLCFGSGEWNTAVAAAKINVDTIELHLLIFQQFSFFYFIWNCFIFYSFVFIANLMFSCLFSL